MKPDYYPMESDEQLIADEFAYLDPVEFGAWLDSIDEKGKETPQQFERYMEEMNRE